MGRDGSVRWTYWACLGHERPSWQGHRPPGGSDPPKMQTSLFDNMQIRTVGDDTTDLCLSQDIAEGSLCLSLPKEKK